MDAGWYPDPTGRNEHRYWDGSSWTDQVSTAGRPARDPVTAAPYAPAPAPRKGRGRGCLVAALALVVLVVLAGVLGVVLLVASDDDEPTTLDRADRVIEPPADDTDDEVEDADAVVGDVIEIGDDELARLNAVTPDAPPLDEFSTPEPGTTFTQLDVEQCAGDDTLPTNPLYWSVQLDDGSMVEATIGAQGFETLTLAPGGCQRGDVIVTVPDGRTVTSVVLTNEILVETGRWEVRPAPAPSAPLEPEEDPESSPVGEQIEALGGHAVTHGLTPDAPPANEFATPPAGTTFTRLDVEVCAGSEPVPVNPLYWFGVLDDNTILEAHLGGQTLLTLELAPDQCQRGTVEVAVPDGRDVVGVLFTDASVQEVARWSVS